MEIRESLTGKENNCSCAWVSDFVHDQLRVQVVGGQGHKATGLLDLGLLLIHCCWIFRRSC